MGEKEMVEGSFLGQIGCPKHGSSDSLSLYEKVIDDKKVIDGHCWSECGFIGMKELVSLGVIDEEGEILVDFATKSKGGVFVMTDEIKKQVDAILNLDVKGWRDRKIPAIVSEYYGVRTKTDGVETEEHPEGKLLQRFYPSTEKGEIVGWHVRNVAAKEARNNGEKIDTPPFFALGKVKSDCELFGQYKFQPGSKYVVLCSGEEDAQAIFTAMNTEKVGRKLELKKYITPVVSTTVGESAIKQIQNNYDWITSFENVIIMYDNDKAGREGAEKVAKLMKAGQAKIAKYERKDACEHSSLGEFNKIIRAFWEAERYSPVDMLHLGEMWDDFENEDNNAKIPFPASWSTVNDMLGGGMEKGEITVIGALTSIGKSSIINNIVYNLIENTKFKVGAMYLESTKREVVRDLLSLDAGINLRSADRSTLDMTSLKNRFFGSLASKDQFVYCDHQGSLANNEIFDKFNYLAKGENCDVIVLDPVQAAVNSSDNGSIIEFMDTMLKFAKETDTCVILVSHMRKPSSEDPHHVSEYDLLGSSSINQIAFNTILLSRDKMHKEALVRNSTKIKIVKNRRNSETGDAGWLRYDHETTHIFASSDPYEQLNQMDMGLMPEELMDENLLDYSGKNNVESSDEWEVIQN
jgi:twinkle protein